MQALTFEQARKAVLEQGREHLAKRSPRLEEVALLEAAGRVLARDVYADRNYPPLDRSMRDGFAVRSADLPGGFQVLGEVRAGGIWTGRKIGEREAVEIMTGAPVPDGADCIVMVEHTSREGDSIETQWTHPAWHNINRGGVEAQEGTPVLKAGSRIDYAGIAALATVGAARVSVFRRPEVAIIATGDEIVPVEATPQPHQIRNSNAQALAVQVARAGGLPKVLEVAADELEATRRLVEEGLRSDLLLLSGGVSAGKYDLVETVLSGFGAQFYFDRVLIQPGQPLVFGQAQGKLFFGLPGNPSSTMVTFEVFARAIVDLLSGLTEPRLALLSARLTEPFRHKPGLTRFLPAMLSPDGAELTPVRWQGSSDVFAMAQANAFLVTDSDRESWEAGDWMRVLAR